MFIRFKVFLLNLSYSLFCVVANHTESDGVRFKLLHSVYKLFINDKYR